MTSQPDLVCRLLAASATAYAIGQEGGIEKSPQFQFVDFVGDTPDVIQDGLDDIDACLVGEIEEGVLVAFRGTLPVECHDIQALLDWMNDFDADPVSVEGLPGKVHDGFQRSVLNLWDGMVAAIQKRLTGNKRLLVTGHSKGAGMTPIAAALLVARGVVPADRISTLIGFAMPKPGNDDFRDYVRATFPTLERYSYRNDIVPHLPPSTSLVDLLAALPEVGKLFKPLKTWDYKTVGTLNFIDWKGRIVGPSTELEIKRVAKLVQAIVMGKFSKIAKDHSLTGGYCGAVCSPDVCTGKTCKAAEPEAAATV